MGTSHSERWQPIECFALALSYRFFGPRGSRALEGFRCARPLLRLAGQLGIREALAHDLANQKTEAVGIAQGQAIIESESLLIHVAEQVEGFDRNVGPADGPLQKTPEILHAVGMHRSEER